MTRRRKRRVALYFGSFNPLHKGHFEILRYLLERTDADEVRMVVTPKNPFGKKDLADAAKRLEDARRVISEHGLPVEVSDVEFNMEEPTYTIKTLEYLDRAEPDCEHILVIGADNLSSLSRWDRYRDLINNYEIWVYPRDGYDVGGLCYIHNFNSTKKMIIPLTGPLYNISSTEIREGEKAGRDMSAWRL